MTSEALKRAQAYASTYPQRMYDARGYVVSNAAPCPRRVAGKMCQCYSRGWALGEDGCICRRHYHLFDHAAIWRDRERRYVFTAEPYHVDEDELAAASVDVNALGLVLEVTTESYWFSGTTLLVVRRP